MFPSGSFYSVVQILADVWVSVTARLELTQGPNLAAQACTRRAVVGSRLYIVSVIDMYKPELRPS